MTWKLYVKKKRFVIRILLNPSSCNYKYNRLPSQKLKKCQVSCNSKCGSLQQRSMKLENLRFATINMKFFLTQANRLRQEQTKLEEQMRLIYIESEAREHRENKLKQGHIVDNIGMLYIYVI